MSTRKLSYKQVLSLAFDDHETCRMLADACEQHKQWGGYSLRIHSSTLVLLLDAYKALAEQQLGDQVPVEIDEEDAPSGSDA